MSDLINRQAAIEAVIAEGRNVDSRYLESERIIHESDAVEALSILPSAQTEIIKCKDCKYADEYYRCPYTTWWGRFDDFCSRAERRTDE